MKPLRPIDVPGVGTANSERRCIFALGVDMPIRAMKPGLQVSLQLDEFDPSQTPIADFRVQGRVQIDAMRR